MTPGRLHRLRRSHLAGLRREVRRLTKGLKDLGAEKVWLIGSLADGTANLFSDADRVAIMRSDKPFLDRLRDIYSMLRPSSVDVFVYTPNEFTSMRKRPFLKHALKRAIALHEK